MVDFASLYPSIIQAHNLCYSTMITPGEEHRLAGLRPGAGEDYESFRLTGGVYHFVKKHVHESFLASLLTSWLAKRKAIKKLLAACEDPRQRTILDKQQLAIKCTCNAVYGFTGVANGLFPCLSIAETVTLQGRTMLERAKAFVEALSPANLQALAPSPDAWAPLNPEGQLRPVPRRLGAPQPRGPASSHLRGHGLAVYRVPGVFRERDPALCRGPGRPHHPEPVCGPAAPELLSKRHWRMLAAPWSSLSK